MYRDDKWIRDWNLLEETRRKQAREVERDKALFTLRSVQGTFYLYDLRARQTGRAYTGAEGPLWMDPGGDNPIYTIPEADFLFVTWSGGRAVGLGLTAWGLSLPVYFPFGKMQQ